MTAAAPTLAPAAQALRSCLAGLVRTLGSTNVVDRGRVAAALLDGQGRALAASGAAPIANLQALAARAAAFPGGLEPGDALLTNDPYAGGTRVSDLFVLSPLAAGGWAAVCAPTFDVGGTRLGNDVPEALDLFAEGVRLTPVRLARAGRPDADVLRVLRLNSRTPALIEADALALLDAALDLAGRADGLAPAPGDGRAAVQRALAGRAREATVGNVVLRLAGTTFDLKRCSAQRASSANATRETTLSAIARALADRLGCALDHGVLAGLTVLTIPGSVVHCTQPAATGGPVPDQVRAAVEACLA